MEKYLKLMKDNVSLSVAQCIDKLGRIKLANVQIVGIQMFRDKQHSKWRRLLWASVLLVGFLLACTFIRENLVEFIAAPTAVTLANPDHADSCMPAVTVCVEDMYNFATLFEMWVRAGNSPHHLPNNADMILLDQNKSLTYETLIREAGYKFDTMVTKCRVGPSRSCRKFGCPWTSVITRYGLCYSLAMHHKSWDGPMYGVHIALDYVDHPFGTDFGGFLVAVHDPTSPPERMVEHGVFCNVRHDDGRSCSSTTSVYVTRRRLLRRQPKPCSSDRSYSKEACLQHCQFKAFVNIVGCRLPHMSIAVRPCEGREEIEAARDAMLRYFEKGAFKETSCDCPESCSYVSYITHTDTVWASNRTALVSVYMGQKEMQLYEEYYSYLLIDLAGDAGGVLGLMLGVSVLTLMQIFEYILAVITRRLMTR